MKCEQYLQQLMNVWLVGWESSVPNYTIGCREQEAAACVEAFKKQFPVENINAGRGCSPSCKCDMKKQGLCLRTTLKGESKG